MLFDFIKNRTSTTNKFLTDPNKLTQFHNHIVNLLCYLPEEKQINPQFYIFKDMVYLNKIGCYLYWIKINNKWIPFTLDVEGIDNYYYVSSHNHYIRNVDDDYERIYWKNVCIAANVINKSYQFDFIVDTNKLLNNTGIIRQHGNHVEYFTSLNPQSCEKIFSIDNYIQHQKIVSDFRLSSSEAKLSDSEVKKIESSHQINLKYYNDKVSPRLELKLVLQEITDQLQKECNVHVEYTESQIDNILLTYILPKFTSLSSSIMDVFIPSVYCSPVKMYWSLTFDNRITIVCMINNKQVLCKHKKLGGNVFQLYNHYYH